jgi:glutaredoxin 3
MTLTPTAPEVVVYRTRYCPYCTLATRLLSTLGVGFREVDVSGDPERRRWLARESGQRTVPQIFVGERSIGGYNELRQLLHGGAAALFNVPLADVGSEEAKGGARPPPKEH